jgi:hypothetical protein
MMICCRVGEHETDLWRTLPASAGVGPSTVTCLRRPDQAVE